MVYLETNSIFLLLFITQATGQFFDFFSALQPAIRHPIQANRHYDVTTKRIKTQKSPSLAYNLEIGPKNSHRNSANPDRTKERPNLSSAYVDYTTRNPFSSGVRPAVANGPPITNRPTTRRYDEDASPELIIGPNEDYMSATEKRRHIDMADRMCEKYKNLGVKQVQAIPLVPSPRPVRVNVSSCVPTEVALVVGGRVVTIEEFPHMALLGWPSLVSEGYSWKCGGSLLSDQYVLTAAHCAYQDKDNSVATGPPRAVQLGSSYLNEPSALVVKVASVTRHPKYKLPKSYYDIALIRLAKTVSFSKTIRPACLGTAPSAGRPVVVTGWGRTEFGGSQSRELRGVSIPVWDFEQCREVLGTSRKLPSGPLSDSQICAGEFEGGKDTCQGDSGGPAQIQDGCLWRVVAVTSIGRSCGAARTPALYAKVHPAFISAVIYSGQTDKQTQNQQNFNQNSYNQNPDAITFNNDNRQNHRETTTVKHNQQNQNQGSISFNNRHKQRVETTTIKSYNHNPQQNQDSIYYNSQNQNRRETTTVKNYNQQNNYGNNNNKNNRDSNQNRRTESTNNNYDNSYNQGTKIDQNYDSDYYNQNRRVETTTKRHYTNNNGYYNYETYTNNKDQNQRDPENYNKNNNQYSNSNYGTNYNQNSNNNREKPEYNEYYQSDDASNYQNQNQNNNYYNQNNNNQNQNNNYYNQYTTENYYEKPYSSERYDDPRIWWT